ncbi:heat-inducible transcriptional repressor HrcA [Terribacillus saccharophilus]|uniref:heat-inducible transcriptional repressor HrcA n=1 Tax=Terribacillus saccharophilus TaxID=361277 RepID=UPI000C9D0045|nr:heat-inducible transcriptional repressor HrcA [Terribacillus goriensis]
MLTERQLRILQVIVDDFIQTALPIGSRAISNKQDVAYSAATIRNDMAELEQLGLIEKTHTSSGRIPSEKGYRFYVDHLLTPFNLSRQDTSAIKQTFSTNIRQMEEVVQQSAALLSELTNYTSIILGPEMLETKLKHIQILTLSDFSAVMILVTDTGHVEHKSFRIPDGMDHAEMEKVVNILNDRLAGVPLMMVPGRLKSEVQELLKQHTVHFDTMFAYLRSFMETEQPLKLYFGGKTNILMQPDFQDLNKLRSLYTMIEEEGETIARLLKGEQNGLHVSIGTENKLSAMQDCSFVTASYTADGIHMGTVALLGPTRMEYSRVMSLMHVLTNKLTSAYQDWQK